MLRLGIRAHDTIKLPFVETVENISDLGFCCTQLALKKLITEFNVSREAMTPGMAFYMKDVFGRNHVDVAVLGCYLNLTNPDATQLAEIQKNYEAHIRFASLLGCGMVGTETGAVNVAYQFEPANHSDEALNIFIHNLKPIVSYAEKMGVIMAVEPVYKHIMCDIKRTRKVLDAINSPNLRVIFDATNVMSVKNHTKQDEIIEEAFDLVGEEIAVLHIKDFVVSENQIISRPVTLGEGELNLELLLKLAKVKKPFVHMLLEDSLPENALISKQYIEKIYQEV
jgi:sugar phosphate isomerase/epimerase